MPNSIRKEVSRGKKNEAQDTGELPSQTAVFKGRKIRKLTYNNDCRFSVVDVVGALTDESVEAGAYWRKLKERLKNEGSEVVTFCHGLKLPAPDTRIMRHRQ
jgi:DNA-damage-inducible protein D